MEKVRLAIRYGADLEARNDEGEVALGYACSYGQLEAARLLVEAGFTVTARVVRCRRRTWRCCSSD